MILDCKKVLKDLEGKDIIAEENKPFTFGEALANILIASEEGGKMKLYVLGTKIYQGNKVEVDESDLSLLKTVVKSSKAYSALISGQCELMLEEVKEAKGK